MEDLLKGLNEAQRQAVEQTEGPVMVMAGAGSGKTKVLTTRIAYIIEELGVDPSGILAVTFTNKAANEMKERVGKMLNIDTQWLWVSTFHSFCVRLLRIESNYIAPYRKGFNIIDDDDQLRIMKNIVKDAELDVKPKEVINLISKEKNGMDFKIHDLDLQSNFQALKRKYQDYLIENNLMDFDDLISVTINLLKANESIRTKYQNKFQYVMVDEFQDTNKPQYELMKLLALKTRNLFVVGDDFQSIYSFRGAKITNIKKMQNDFEGTKLILLEKNYRSTTQILNLANSVIEHNPNQIKKVMVSNNVEGEKPLYYNASSSYDEVMFVVEKIKALVNKGAKYSDFAVLYRSNYLSREYEDAFVKYRIPYRIYGGQSFFSRKEIKDVIAYLRVLINHDDEFSFRRIINEPKRKIGEAILTKLSTKAHELGLNLYNAIPYYDGTGMGASNLRLFKEKMDSIYLQIENVKLPDLIDIITEEMGYIDGLKHDSMDDDEFEDRNNNIKEFKSVLKESEEFYDGNNNIEKLEALLQDLALRTDKEEFKDDDVVRLSTYHQAKGLEFDTVFMVAMEEGIFPSMNSFTNEDIEEERRICYVGVTRAKSHLFLTNAVTRMRFGHTELNDPSRFIREMDIKCYDNYRTLYMKPKPPVNKISKPISKAIEPKNPNSTDIKTGDKINHKVFGDGIVVSTDGELITVAFSMPTGVKKLKASHPAIRKL